MFFNQINKIKLCESFECRDAEVRVLRDEIVASDVEVGEITSAAARDSDFLADIF